jgi:hypothetical protein
MSRLRIVLAALLAVSAVAVLAVPASAALPAANTKFCKAANSIGSDSSSSQPTKAQAKAAIKDFKQVAKHAPRKVKSAIGNITKYLGLVAGADKPSDLAKIYTGSGFKDYTKSITTYIKYYTTQCTGTS